MRTFAPISVALCALALASCETMTDREVTGAIVGGALGGLLGSQFGEDEGKVAMTGLGVAVGAYIGHQIGRSMDERAMAAHDRAAQEALWSYPRGRPYAWRSDRYHGEIEPSSNAYRDRYGRSCRRFNDVVIFEDGQRRVVTGAACVDRNGQWVVTGD